MYVRTLGLSSDMCPLPGCCSHQVADRIRKHMVERVPRLLPAEVEDRVKDFASNVEGLVDKVVSGGCASGGRAGPLQLRGRGGSASAGGIVHVTTA